MSDILNTGKSALFAFQRALSTTSNNIANVNTEGYSRQRVDFQAVGDDRQTVIGVGQGVRIQNIERVHDQFSNRQVNSATSAHSQQKTYHNLASKIDNIIADPSLSITPAINLFFNSLQDANNDPSSSASREIVLDSAARLSQRFQTLQDQLDSTQTEVNNRTRQAVDEVDSLANSIAEINRRIIAVNNSSIYRASNELKDQRDKLVNELSTYIDVETIEEDSGALNVYIGKGISLVINGAAQELKTVQHDVYPDRLKIEIGNDSLRQDIRPRLQGGEIGGLNQFSDTTLHPTMQEVGRVAVVLADQINQQHALGLDLNSDPGGAMFDSPLPQVYSSSRNSGSGVITAQIDDTSVLKGTDYLLRYDGGNLRATRTSDGVEMTGPVPLIIDGLTVNLTGTPDNGDTFVLTATGRAAGGFNELIKDPSKLAMASPLATTSSIDNLGDSTISHAKILDNTVSTFNDPVSFVFTSATNYNIVDTNSGTILSAGENYTEGSPIVLNGWQIQLAGEPRAGDTHNVRPNTEGRGNNANGLELIQLQNALTVEGISTFNDAYGAVVSRVGAHTRAAETRTDALESLLSTAIDRQQATQGVNLDEEAVNLTQYQQAYQASAKIIATADTLFQAILGATR